MEVYRMKRKTYNNVIKASKMIIEKGYEQKEAQEMALQIFKNMEQLKNGMSAEWFTKKSLQKITLCMTLRMLLQMTILSECTTCKNGTNANLTAVLMMWRLVQGRSKVLYFCVKIYLKIKRIGRTICALFACCGF